MTFNFKTHRRRITKVIYPCRWCFEIFYKQNDEDHISIILKFEFHSIKYSNIYVVPSFVFQIYARSMCREKKEAL